MRKLLQEFKSFVMNGNLIDLALGFIIGTAFAKLIESLVGNIIMQFVAAFFGKTDFSKVSKDVKGTPILYGAFLTDLLNFLLLAAALFFVVKLIMVMGVGRGRSFGEKLCPYCHERITPSALTCRHCGQQLVEELPDLAEATRLLDAQRARRRLALPPLPRFVGKDKDLPTTKE